MFAPAGGQGKFLVRSKMLRPALCPPAMELQQKRKAASGKSKKKQKEGGEVGKQAERCVQSQRQIVLVDVYLFSGGVIAIRNLLFSSLVRV